MNLSKLLLVLFLILLIANFSFGDDGIEAVKGKLLKIFGNIIRFLFSILMLAGSALLIFLGIKYIGNWGNPQELHKSILYITIGIVLLVVSLFIPNLIKSFIENAIK